MANCPLTSGRQTSCRDVSGGIQSLYLIKYGDAGFDPTVSGMQVTTVAGAALTVYKFALHANVGSGTSTLTNDPTGSRSYEQVVTAQLHKMDLNTSDLADEIDAGRWHIILEDINGAFWLYGKTSGLYRSGDTVTGQARADFNGYNLTFTGQEPRDVYSVADAWLDEVDITVDDGSV